MFLCQVTILHPPSVTLDQSYQHRSGGSILELVCSVKVGIIVIEIKKDPLPPLQPPSTPPQKMNVFMDGVLNLRLHPPTPCYLDSKCHFHVASSAFFSGIIA